MGAELELGATLAESKSNEKEVDEYRPLCTVCGYPIKSHGEKMS